MAAYRFGHSSCNSGLFPFKIGLKYAHLQGLYCSCFNQLQPVFFGSVLLGFCFLFYFRKWKLQLPVAKKLVAVRFFHWFFPVAATGLQNTIDFIIYGFCIVSLSWGINDKGGVLLLQILLFWALSILAIFGRFSCLSDTLGPHVIT